MTSLKRVLAGTGAVAIIAASFSLGLASPAFAEPKMTITPNSNLKNGDVVTVKITGYTPNSPVAVGVCPTGRDLKGAGDCGPSKKGASKLSAADGSGNVTVQLTVIKGPLGNLTPPKASCPPCSVGSANISKSTEKVAVSLNYASSEPKAAAVEEAPAVTPDEGTAADDAALPQTGPRETLIMAITGFLLLQLGLVFAVRATRSAPRRSAV